MKIGPWCCLVAGCLCAGLAGKPALGQIAAERFYPPVVTSGTEATIKVDGKLPNWPVESVCTRADVQLTATADASQFQVTVAEDAPPGVAWIRLLDDHSASSLMPLLITRAPLTGEKEPNGKSTEVSSVQAPTVVYGRLEKGGDVDGFRISMEAGDRVVVSVTANRVLGSPMDAVLQIADMQGNVLAQADDVRGIDPQLAFTAPQDDEFIVRIFAFPETPNSTIGFSGSASYVYSLAITAGPFLDHVLPFVLPEETVSHDRPVGWNLPADPSVLKQQPEDVASSSVAYLSDGIGWQPQVPLGRQATVVFESDDPGSPTEVKQLPVVFSGHIHQPEQIDRLRFPVQEGKKYRGEVHARRFGVLLDSVLRVVEPASGKELARNDDRQRGQYDAAVEFTAPADGELELQISELSGLSGLRRAYSLELHEAIPTARLSVSADHFLVKSGEPTTIPVTVQRNHGFAKPLRVSAEGLPAGVTATPVVSEAKGESSKAVELKLTADDSAPQQGSFRILAVELDDQEKPAAQRLTATLALRDDWEISAFWLTVPKPEAAAERQ